MEAIWQQILRVLRGDIAAGTYAPGAKLPTEAELSARFGVNRHTVRRALAALTGEGVIHVRRGAGAYVSRAPVHYPLGRRPRFAQGLAEGGHSAARRISRLETLPATDEEAEALGLIAGALVHVLEGVGLADGTPLSVIDSRFPAALLPDLPQHLGATGSVTEALRRCGIPDYSRAWTRVTAERAPVLIARALDIAEGAPVLRALSLNIDPGGQPVELGRTWFHADRVQLVIDARDFAGG